MTPEEISVSSLKSFRIGNAQDMAGGSGCTVILCEKGAVAGVDVRGGAPASHETELLHPVNTVDRIHAVVLSGGSAFGLEAAAGVMRFLEEKGVGFPVGPITVPIVCGASLFVRLRFRLSAVLPCSIWPSATDDAGRIKRWATRRAAPLTGKRRPRATSGPAPAPRSANGWGRKGR